MSTSGEDEDAMIRRIIHEHHALMSEWIKRDVPVSLVLQVVAHRIGRLIAHTEGAPSADLLSSVTAAIEDAIGAHSAVIVAKQTVSQTGQDPVVLGPLRGLKS